MLPTTKTIFESCLSLPADELLELFDALVEADRLDTWDDEDDAPVFQVTEDAEEEEEDEPEEDDEEETVG